MADFGILKQFRHLLKENDLIQKEGIAVYLGQKEDEKLHVSIELEEIWSHMDTVQGSPCARIKLRGSSLVRSQSHFAKISEAMVKSWDGKCLLLEEGKTGTVRLTGTVIDFPKKSLRTVCHFYEVLVRC